MQVLEAFTGLAERLTTKFRGTIRFFRPEKASGLAVIDIAGEVAAALGGLKQARVRGSINGAEYESTSCPPVAAAWP